MSGVRLLVVDDNPHVLWDGRVHPVNATFHSFLAALLDLPGAPIAQLAHAVPLRSALGPPHSAPVDPRFRTVGTAPFDGIAGFLRHARTITATNRDILAPAVDAADLVLLKVPASNAMLTARLARRSATPLVGWVAGSARLVAAAQARNPASRLAAMAVGAAYDGLGRLAAGERRIVVGKDVVAPDGSGVVASLIEAREIRDPTLKAWQPHRPVRLAWAGRIAAGKGLPALVNLLSAMPEAELVMLGEGPERTALEAFARHRGVGGRIQWRGYVADRTAYLDAIASADAFVHPSSAEGFPKVVLDAMAVGTPVVARPAGFLADIARARLLVPIRTRVPADPTTAAVMGLLRDPAATQALRERAVAFAAAHTRPAEAARLVARLEVWFPDLPWR